MGLREVAFRDGMAEGDRSVFRSPLSWQCATGGYVHVWYSHRYAYSPLVTEPNDYGKSVFGWQWSTAVYLMIVYTLSTVLIHSIYSNLFFKSTQRTHTNVQYSIVCLDYICVWPICQYTECTDCLLAILHWWQSQYNKMYNTYISISSCTQLMGIYCIYIYVVLQ